MIVYLIDKYTGDVLQTFTNVITWSQNFVEYLNNGMRAKIYCSEYQYFTDEIEEDLT